MIDWKEYQRDAMRTLAVHNYRDMALNAATGIASEAGEINEIYKKRFFHNHPESEENQIHLKKELGDLMWYVALVCYCEGFDMEDVLKTNIDKLKARYPDGFSTEKSMNRKEGDI